jgi:branched-chain amino acid transport system substrate-binding protein
MVRVSLIFYALLLLTFSVEAQESNQQRIKIGVVYGFTGAAQVWSEYGRMGLELAEDEINSSGGINGKNIELIFEDSRSNPAQSVAAYRKLVTIDKVKIVLGNIWAFITNPLIPLAAKDNVILVSPTAMQESVERVNGHFFTMGEKIHSISNAVDSFFRLNKDVKTIGIFCWDDTWGQEYLKVWKERASANGVKVKAALCNIDFNNDFRTDVAKMASKKVDAVMIAHLGSVILQRMKEQRFSAKVLATSNLIEDIKVKKAPKELFEGVYVTDWKPSDEFLVKFKRKYGVDAVVEAHNSYETLHSIAKALKISEKNTLEALRKVKYAGVAGLIDFSSSAFANKSVAQLYRVKKGNLEVTESPR